MYYKDAVFLEPSQWRRSVKRALVLESFQDEFSKGTETFPAIAPGPWFRVADPAERRPPYIVRKREVISLSELYYTLCCMIIRRHCAVGEIAIDPADLPARRQMPDEHIRVDDPDYRQQLRQFEETTTELEKTLKTEQVIGIDSAEEDRSGFKFLVFQTAEIDKKTLEAFLDTSELPPEPHKYTSRFSYLFIHTPDLPLERYEMLTTKATLDSLPKSSFIGKSMSDILEAWQEIVKPVTECRSMIATHCFVVLDQNTADGAEIVTVFTLRAKASGEDETYCDHWERHDISFAALKNGLLKGLEMLMVDLGMLEVEVVGERCIVPGSAWSSS